VQKADSGHPGLPLGAAPMAYVLWDRYLRHHPSNPLWPNRDRFVLSAGHGSALLYALLFLTGYGITLDDIKQFRQWGSKTPGHPERGHTPGVEVTTGPLGQGFANAVGMAIAETQLAARYNRDNYTVVDHRTYVLASDGDLMEGVAAEAASLAGHLRLGKLTCLYDDNRVTLAAGTDIAFSEDRAGRFQAYGWHTVTVADGNDVAAIDAALREARAAGALAHPNAAMVYDADRAGDRAFIVMEYVPGQPLRRLVGDDVVETVPPGYRVNANPAQLDARRVEALILEARAQESARRAATLRLALSAWRGLPLGELSSGPFTQSEAGRLEELRLLALEERIDADLELESYAAVVPELEALVEQHPLRERFWRQLMLALYGAGRQAEALATYR